MLKRNKVFLLVSLFIILGAIFRFYNLAWGSPYFFHPDERNIASAITQLSFPHEMNPHFFAYGSLPLYTVYFLGLLHNLILFLLSPTTIPVVSFDQAIILGRILSALLSLSLIPLLYVIGRKIQNKTTGLFAAFFGATSLGFIQYAHFSTFEMWLTFFGTLLFYICLLFRQHQSKKMILLLGCVFGVLISIKVSSIMLLIPVLILFLISTHSKKTVFKKGMFFLFTLLLFLFSAFCIFILSNPFTFIAPSEFLSSMHYESSVVLGTLPVFYTQGFIHTYPVLYQLRYIFPFILNPFVLVLGIFSFFYVCYLSIQKRIFSFFLLIVFFLTLFYSQAFFYAKWTRYMIPTLPFLYLMIAITCATFYHYLSRKNSSLHLLGKLFIGVILIINVLYAFFFVYVIYVEKDSRLTAVAWATKHLEKNKGILSEVYDLGIVPFNQPFPNITLVNFYDLDATVIEQDTLDALLMQTSFLIFPSQRVVKTRLLNEQTFPKGSAFYKKVFSQNGYKKLYETPCTLLCRIIYMGDPVFMFEETTNVFDRPTVYIFKKI